MAVIRTAFALAVAVWALVPGVAAEEAENANLNRDAKISLLLERGVPAQEGLRRAILAGRSIQATVAIDAKSLLDPNSVAVEWNGQPIPHFVYYKQADFAMIFALPDFDRMAEREEGELTMTAKLVGADAIAAGWRLPVTISRDEATSAALAFHNRTGPATTIRGADGRPAAGAWFFGQRRADLLALADAEGRVILDAPSRNTPGPHYAWNAESWTAAFESMTNPDVTLVPREGNTRAGSLVAVDVGGLAVQPIVVLVDNNSYVVSVGNSAKLDLRSDMETELLILSPGHAPLRYVAPLAESEVRAVFP